MKSELQFKLIHMCLEKPELSIEMPQIWLVNHERPIEIQGDIFKQKALNFGNRPKLFENKACWDKTKLLISRQTQLKVL